MNIKKHFLFFLFLTTIIPALSLAEYNEYYVQFAIQSKTEIETLTRIVSIDDIRENLIFAYANDIELQELKALGYEITQLPHPGTLYEPRMSESVKAVKDWNVYPTYETYVDLMYQFAQDYPDLCQIEQIGTTVQGRALLFAKISGNVNQEEAEPEFMYTATMHGDETGGYILMLHLIDYLLSNYSTDAEVRQLVDSIEIWINPLANPDGTYYGGNSTVFGARRYNANSVDLNRNFPDPGSGDHPDGKPWQPETIAMMDFASTHSFVHGANFHGGSEVANYPWDTWAPLHADDTWYRHISRQYADSAQFYGPVGYFNDLENGITNGYAWYTMNGGRMDYMNYFQHSREVTLEISATKLLPESQLLPLWNYNRASLLTYIKQTLYGITGTVKDIDGNPLAATITLIGHDFDHSEIYTDPDVGDYHRVCLPGTYDLQVEAAGFEPQIFNDVLVVENTLTVINIIFGESFATGDVNQDGEINILDVMRLINFILSTEVPNPTEFQLADFIEDSILNIQDIVALVRYILNQA
jgi:hypothetical protein